MTQFFDGETGAAIAPQLWCVHVFGPDDVIPAPDQEAAKRWAARLNKQFVSILTKDPHPHDPIIRAEAAPWPWSAEAHAEGPSAEYRWLADERPIEPAEALVLGRVSAVTDPKAASDLVNHPAHYAGAKWESIDVIEALGNQFRLGNALKYLFRHEKKGGIEDLKKARWYLERELAQERPTRSPSFDKDFYRQNSRDFAANFGVLDAGLARCVAAVSSAHHHAYLGMPTSWRHDVRDAISCLNAYILGLEGVK